MYSNKENVNILTALLVSHGIRHAVVCPGSRNAPIVHNLNECPDIECHPVTDERSAGFYAVGMAQALDEPVVVCVTSGSALLNLAPAVAEAYYQHLPVVVVSADRPQGWIDQLDGQTLPQPDALGRFVSRAVTLPEPRNDEERWYCNRLVNEALLETHGDEGSPVHINVPVSEPLFNFSAEALPKERVITRFTPSIDYDCLHAALLDDFLSSQRPMVVFGQTNPHHFAGETGDYLFSHVITLHEARAPFPSVSHFDEVLYATADNTTLLPPDFILYVGDCIVSKRLKRFLRQAHDAKVWRISPSGQVEDTFMNLRGIVKGDPEFTLGSLSHKMKNWSWAKPMAYRRQWLQLLRQAATHANHYEPAYSQMATVKYFEEKLEALRAGKEALCPSTEALCSGGEPLCPIVHYANSTAVRLANIYARHHVWCNRGVNGIEGSLSTAAGYSVVSNPAKVFCVIGDLSFFYDQNALWNLQLCGNLRILLLNNGQGGIFNLLAGLEQSPARNTLVAAAHHTTAEGICQQNDIYYQHATNMEDMKKGIDLLFEADFSRPVLIEVQTDVSEDERIYKDYYQSLVLEA